MVVLAVFIACAFIAVLAIAVPACAQKDTGSGEDLPVTFILDNMMDAHEQNIKQKIFEYKFDAASDDPAEQLRLVQERSAELKNVTAAKKSVLMALMAGNGSVSDKQMAAIVDEMNVSIEKITGWSKKLQDNAAGLAMLNGRKTYSDSVVPLIDDVNATRDLASKASEAAKGKKNYDNGNIGNGGNAGTNDNSGKKK